MNTKDYIKLAQLCAAIQDQSDKKQLIVKQILQREGDINFKIPAASCARLYDQNYSSHSQHLALRAALQSREIAIFDMLLAHGADFSAKSENGETILHHAIANSCFKYANCWKIKGRLKHPFIDSILLAHVNTDNSDNSRNEHGISHFHAACMTNNVKAVEFYLNHGVSVNEAVNADSTVLAGYTALHFAARYCCLETAKTLLSFGANSHLKDANGITPLYMLIERNMQIVDWMNMGKRAAYDQFIADFEDNEQMIELILETNYSDWKVFDDIGLSRFHVACTIYDQSRIEDFLGKFVDLERAVDENSAIWPGYTPLHFAAHFNVETVKLLLKNGANILAKDAKGNSPFDLCLQRYEAEDICYLVTSQPSWKHILFSDNQTRLSELVYAMRSAKRLKSYLERLTNINTCIPKDSPLWAGCTPLHLATIFPERSRDIVDLFASSEYDDGDKKFYNCSQAHEKLYLQRIQVCLQLKADATMQDAFESTPLHRAFRLRRESAVNAFLRDQQHSGESRNFTDERGLSHLHIACAAQRRDLIDKLLDEGNVNEPVPSSLSWFIKPYAWDSSSYLFHISAGSTLLHMAVSCENADLAEMLLKRGADVYAKDANALTAIHRSFVIRSPNSTAAHLFSADHLKECVVAGGLSHLHVASLMGSSEAVGKLLDNGANVNASIAYKGYKSSSSSSSSSSMRAKPAFDLYKDRSSEPLSFLSPYDGYTALHFAVENHHVEVVEVLLQRGADMLADKSDGSTPLGTALHNGYRPLVRVFVRTLKRDRSLQERMAKDMGLTMLHIACATLDLDSATELIDAGADVNARAHKDSHIWPGCAPLHLLSTPLTQEDEHQIGAVLDLLLRHGADVTLLNDKQSSPIHKLHSFVDSYIRNDSHVDALLDAQKDYNVNPVNNNGISHFHVACARNRLAIVAEFLKGGADVNHAIDHFHGSFGGYTSLHLAVYKDCQQTIELLLKHGADVNAEDRHGNTPLHVVAERDDISRRLIERVINGGANICTKNLLGKTLFEMLLAKYTDVPAPIVELFLKHGWQVNTFNPISEEGTIAMAFSTNDCDQRGVDKPGFKALMNAKNLAALDEMGRNAIHNIVSTQQPQHRNSAEDYADAIEILVRSGCDYDHQDNLGRTPLHLAVQFRQIEAITGLLQSGADVNVVDATGRPAFTFIFKYLHKRLIHDRDIVVNLAVHLRKMVLLRLDVNELNVKTVIAAQKAFPFNVLVDKEFDKNMEKLKDRKISSTHISLYDFLSETGAVSTYPYTTPQERLAIKEIFDNQFESLRKEFPEVAGFLRLQYKKARARPPLIDPAIASLRIILGFELPVLCSDVILKFLRNKDLKNMIAAAEY